MACMCLEFRAIKTFSPVTRTNRGWISAKAASSTVGLFVTALLVNNNVDKPMTGKPMVSLAASASANEDK